MVEARRAVRAAEFLAVAALLLAQAACGGGGMAPPAAVCGDGIVAGAEQCDDHNLANGDGCQADCTPTPGLPEVVTCAALAPLPAATCAVTSGDTGLLVTGTVLVPGRVWRGGQVAVDAAGTITCVGCDCTGAPGAATATRYVCPTGVVSPGLVNLHDFLLYSHDGPAAQTAERYEHRHDWRHGLGGHTRISAPGNATADQQRWGELRGLLAGTTSSVGAGGQAGLQRNLASPTLQEGLGRAAVAIETFPLGDAGGTTLTASCAYPASADPASWADAPGAVLVVGEGIGLAARNEVACTAGLAPGGTLLAGPTAAFSQGVGASAAELSELAASSTALVWSPRSNVSLYGNTAAVTVAARLGVQLALATDWAVTGSSTMLRELACADEWNRDRLDGFFTDERLWLMATRDAADAAGLLDALGVLAPGRAGDLVIFDGRIRDAHRAVVAAGAADVALVVRGGKVLYGDAALVASSPGGPCEPLDVCSTAKQACVAADAGVALAALSAANASGPGLFACGTPLGERTCIPSRPASVDGSTVYAGVPAAGDRDGDGLPDGADACPAVFDPVRPMDGGAQADADGDGVGDACDPCPLLADATACPAVDPADPDGDGVPSVSDNCPLAANAPQADADADGHGDACDLCPADANPGAQGCPVTIYQLKSGQLFQGQRVTVRNALVTARAADGFSVQVKPGDPDFAGADLSGLWVVEVGSAAVVGQRVDVEGSVSSFFGAWQLVASRVVAVTLTSEAPPDPVVVAASDVATGGPRAAALEGVLVQVGPVTVEASGLAGNEFSVNGGLVVDDLFHLTAPAPALGQDFVSFTGVLLARGGQSKLEPRSAGDVVAGAPMLSGFGPASTFAWLGTTAGPTIPAPLTVTLSGPPSSDTFVTVTSADPAVAVVGGGATVLAGSSSAPVLVDAAARAAGVTLTASLGAVTRTASVRVLDPALDLPALAALDPAAVTAPAGGTVAFTVALDLPPAAPLAVAVSTTGGTTCPATVDVPAEQLQAIFDCTAPADGTATVSVGLGGAELTSTVTVASAAGLILNEVDYDGVGADTAEFIELYNPTGAAVDLAGKAVVLVNGGVSPGAAYATVPLDAAGALAPGQYLVICTSAVTPGAGAAVLGFDGSTTPGVLGDRIQNGAPDGVALVDTAAGTLLDALSYEGPIAAATIAGLPGTVSLVEGTALPVSTADSNTAVGSLARVPDGVDTDAAADWTFTGTPTPGAANQ